jgi:hypothetical protein
MQLLARYPVISMRMPVMSPEPLPARPITSVHGIVARKSRCSSLTFKRILRMARLRLRGPCGARDEFLLAATAQNLRRLAKLRPSRLPSAAIAA